MYHYDPATALEELQEDAVLPNPVHIRDMIVRARLEPDQALEYGMIDRIISNRELQPVPTR